ncbi:hypothetical protein [Microlunatus sp. Y2014]|uniref:hypothetical protein n=1 Tax=Microlunatus sp. Y2014 TaxID=3418488 RepID=UPI003DA72322
MMAIANLQASIDRLTEMVEEVAIAIEDLREHFNDPQESEILAMVETIDSDVYERYLRTGTVAETDWDRIASAEQLFKTQHRAIRLKLDRLLKYDTIKSARHTVRNVTPQQIRNWITLEAFLVRALYRWTTLMLKVREQRGELNSDDVDNAYRHAEDYRSQAQRMVARLRENPTPAGRSRLQQLRTDGLVRGFMKDRRGRKKCGHLGRRGSCPGSRR